MSSYRIGSGHDVALGSLTEIDPQPASTGIQATRRTYGADGTPFDEGLYVELEWSALEDATEYQSLLTQFGLSLLPSAAVTVYVRDSRWQWVRANGLAILPEMGREARWDNYFPRRITILIRNLELLEEP